MSDPAAYRATGGRLLAARVLVVLASLTAVVALIAGYLRYQAFDTPTFKNTAADLIADPKIQSQVAATLVDQLYANVDVAAALRQELPPDQKRLAAPIAGAVRELADRAALRLMGRPGIQSVWVASATAAQSQLLRLLEDRGAAIRTNGGNVVLDLRPLVIKLGDQVAIVGNLADRLPQDKLQITIMRSDQLESAQKSARLLKAVGSFAWAVPLALIAIAMWLARGRRRTMLRAAAIGAVIAGLLVLVVRRVAGSYITNHLVSSVTVKPAAQSAWDILTNLLADGALTLVFVAAVALVGVWVAGESRSGLATRRAIAGPIARAEIAFGGVVAFMTLLVWWGPTPQARRSYLVLVGLALLALGVEVLRRQTAREARQSA
jgi:hypothetical protein